MESIREININNLDLNKQNYNNVSFKQDDTTRLIFNIYKNGVTIDLSGSSFSLIFTKPDKTFVLQDTDFDTTNVATGILKVLLDIDCLRSAGEGNLELEIKKDGNRISSFLIPYVIQESGLEGIPSESKATINNELNTTINNAVTTKTELENVIATANTTTYATQGQVTEINESLAEKATLSSVNFKGCYLEKTLEKLYKGEDTLFMFIGDSVTCGSNATDQLLLSYTGLFASWIAEQFPNATVKLARGSNIQSLQPLTGFTETIIQTGTKNTITIVNAGIWGDSMFQLFNRANNFTSYSSIIPDCVFIMDGINDSDPGNLNRYSDTATFKELQGAFVDYLSDITNAEIVIQTSHWTGSNPNSRINPYVVAQRELAKEKNLLLIDHKAVWDAHYDWYYSSTYGQNDWMANGDDIHPINMGHVSIKDTIVSNIYKTKIENDCIITPIPLSKFQNVSFNGTWGDYTISDVATDTTYTYKRTSTAGSYFTSPLAGNEIYAIVRDGRDEVVFNNNSPDYDNEQIKIGGMIYPSQFVTVNNADMYSKHHKRVLLYKGSYKYCQVTLEHVSGNLDVYGFETVTYKKDIIEEDTSTTLTLYTDSTNGDDKYNDGLSSTTAFKTIAKAIEYSRDYLNKKNIVINIMSDTTENIDISLLYPLSSQSFITQGYNNTVKNIGYLKVQQAGKMRFNYLKTITNADQSILLNDVDYCRLDNVNISDTTNQTKTGLMVVNGSTCYASSLTADYKATLTDCESSSRLTVGLTNNPTNSTILANAITGGIISFINANIPQYPAKLTKATGGVMFNTDGTLL